MGHSVGAVVCARALLETLATFSSLLKRSQKAADSCGWSTIGKLVDAYAFSTTVGLDRKNKTDEHPPRVGKLVLEFIKSTHPGKEQFWEQICEVAHPNGKSMLKLAGQLNNSRLHSRSSMENETLLFPAIYNCLYSCCWLRGAMLDFDILLEQIRFGGNLPEDHPLLIKKSNR